MTHWRPLPLPSLASGRGGQAVLQVLQRLSNDVKNLRSAGPGYQDVLSRYMQWVSSAETQLRSVFDENAAVDALHTRRYWFLLGLDPAAAPWRILNDELEHQGSTLDRYVQQLNHEIEAFRLEEEERAVVIDTNFFLHYQRIDQINWPKHLKAKGGHRIVIPAVVIKELDEKKYHPNESLSRRAAGTIRFLYDLRGDAHPEEPVRLNGRSAAKVQILLDPAEHHRSATADDEILNRAEHLASVAGGRVTVGSADYGVHLAAAVRGLDAWRPDDSLLRRSRSDDPTGSH